MSREGGLAEVSPPSAYPDPEVVRMGKVKASDVVLHKAEGPDDRQTGILEFECKVPQGTLVLKKSYVLQDGELEDTVWELNGKELNGLEEWPYPDLRRKDWASPEKVCKRIASAVQEWLDLGQELPV